MLKVGERRGMLTVLDATQATGQWDGPVKVRCDCGNEKWVRRDNLLGGHTTSCGCRRGQRFTELMSNNPFPQHLAPRNDDTFAIGSVHGRWTVISEIQPSSRALKRKNRTVWCECSCEDHTVREVPLTHLGKKSKSCGCLVVEGNSLRTKEA